LGNNIYHGMHAQILFNPTFGRWSFGASSDSINRPDGGMTSESDSQKIAQRARSYHERMGLHDAGLLLRDFADGCAFGWVRQGATEEVVLSPDVGPCGQRAQRITPLHTTAAVVNGKLCLNVSPYTLVRVSMRRAQATRPWSEQSRWWARSGALTN
jgi:hypothetical protein